MSAKIIVDGQYGRHDFDHQDPLNVLTALQSEAADKVKNAQRVLENAENNVIAAQVNLNASIAVRDRYNAAIDALVDAGANAEEAAA